MLLRKPLDENKLQLFPKKFIDIITKDLYPDEYKRISERKLPIMDHKIKHVPLEKDIGTMETHSSLDIISYLSEYHR